MKINVTALSLLLTLLVITLPSSGFAQTSTNNENPPHEPPGDSNSVLPENRAQLPFTPKPLKPSEVIFTLDYTDSPLTFPFNEVSHDRVLSGNYQNFRFGYSNPYQQVVKYFDDASNNGTKLPLLVTSVANFASSPEVVIIGKKVAPDKSTFTVSSVGKPYQITFDIVPTSRGTEITVRGLKSSTVFGGTMPVRGPFKPADANQQPFRWN